jgi:hypothetical protein
MKSFAFFLDLPCFSAEYDGTATKSALSSFLNKPALTKHKFLPSEPLV